MKRWGTRSAVVFAIGILMAGCGSSDNGTADTPAEPNGATATVVTPAGADQPGLEAAVRAYSQAYLAGQGSVAHGLLSQRCQERISTEQMAALAQAAQVQYGAQDISTLTVDALAGTLARVSYAYTDPAINQREEPWVFANGAWHQDDC